MIRFALIGATTVAMLAVPALARDRMGTQAIAAGDFVKAEQVLTAERRIFPKRPELMLNMALVYERTGRAAQATALYGEVLKRDAVAMDMPSGAIVSSHDLAKAGLARTSGARVATR